MTALAAVARATPPASDEPSACTCGGIDRLLDLPKVADALSMGLSSVYELVEDGAITAVDAPGRGTQRKRRRVRTSELRRYIDSLQRITPAAS